MDVIDTIHRRVIDKIEKLGKKVHIHYSAHPYYPPVDNLDEIPIEGTVIIVKRSFGWGNGRTYISPVLENPTWLGIAICANDAIEETGDFHHIFLESIRVKRMVDGVKSCEICMGS